MKTSLRTKLLPLAIATLLAATPILAQDTSSAISGHVLDAQGKPVVGATVQIVHEPSGTTKTTITDAEGRYAAQGLRVGGPFDVKVTKDGATQAEQDKVYLQLAQDTPVNLTVGGAPAADAKNLAGVTVTANALTKTFSSDNKGISTNISRREIVAQPTPNRSIQNIARMDPRIVVTDRSRGEISANGQNSRYNNITIDSVSANDPFGLNANGLPTLGTPISQDTIEEYQLSTANYDVTNRRGLGATMNLVTRSGTNDYHGSVYYAFRNNNMIGDNQNDKPYTGFSREWTAGATFGGPIIKDKLFFFAGYEKSTQIGPGTPYGAVDSGAASPIAGLTSAQVQAVRDAAAKYGLNDIGTAGGGNSNLLDKRTMAKLDWNIADNHRASFTFYRTKETKPIITGNNTNLVLSSGWYKTAVDNKNYVLHFYDDWSDIFSTDTTVSYSNFVQNRGPYNGVDMPDIKVYPNTVGGPSVEFGTEYSSQANVLKVKTLNAAWAGTLYLGDHTLKGGVDFEKDSYYNLFVQNLFGSYTFEDIKGNPNTGLQNFLAGNYYQYFYNRPANGLGLNDTAAAYGLKQYGVFLQDTWQVNDRLSLQYGVRVDIPLMGDQPLYNAAYAAAPGVGVKANPNQATGGFGRTNQTTINGNRVVQPRLSFNYTFDTEHMTQLRGGAGLFVSNPPGVWIGNIFSNSGVTQTQYNCGPTQKAPCTGTNIPPFSADPHAQNNGAPGSGAMTVNTVSPGFQIPSAWKLSLGFDKELPWWGLVATVDYEHIKQRDAIWYQAINLGKPTGVLPDRRFTYYKNIYGDPKATGQQPTYNANPAFSSATINLADSSRGKADSLTLALKKSFSNDWSGMVGFTWSRATEVNPGTSSVASSNYKYDYVTNSNENIASTSNYSVPKRVIASLNWQHNFFGDYATSASAFFDGHSAYPYSWSFGNDANGDSYLDDLAFIPKPGQVEFRPGTNPALVQSFYDYIQRNDYLKDHQGDIAKRNGDRAGWINQIDLSFSQEIPGLFKGNKGVVRLDVYNFTNLLNKNWGIEKRVAFPGGRALADFYGVDPATGKYIYNIDCGGAASCTNYVQNGKYHPLTVPTYVNNGDDLQQRWSVLLTVRYSF